MMMQTIADECDADSKCEKAGIVYTMDTHRSGEIMLYRYTAAVAAPAIATDYSAIFAAADSPTDSDDPDWSNASIPNQDRNRYNASICRFLFSSQFKGSESELQAMSLSAPAQMPNLS